MNAMANTGILPSTEDTFDKDIMRLQPAVFDNEYYKQKSVNEKNNVIPLPSNNKAACVKPPAISKDCDKKMSRLYRKILHEIEEIMEEEEMLGLQPDLSESFENSSVNYKAFEKDVGQTSTQDKPMSMSLYDRLKLRSQNKISTSKSTLGLPNTSLRIKDNLVRRKAKKKKDGRSIIKNLVSDIQTKKCCMENVNDSYTIMLSNNGLTGDVNKKNECVNNKIEGNLCRRQKESKFKGPENVDNNYVCNNESSGNLFLETKRLGDFRKAVSKYKPNNHKTRKRNFKTIKSYCLKNNATRSKSKYSIANESKRPVYYSSQNMEIASSNQGLQTCKTDFAVNVRKTKCSDNIPTSKQDVRRLKISRNNANLLLRQDCKNNGTKCDAHLSEIRGNKRKSRNDAHQMKRLEGCIEENLKPNHNIQKTQFVWPNKSELRIVIETPMLKSSDLVLQEKELRMFYNKEVTAKDKSKNYTHSLCSLSNNNKDLEKNNIRNDETDKLSGTNTQCSSALLNNGGSEDILSPTAYQREMDEMQIMHSPSSHTDQAISPIARNCVHSKEVDTAGPCSNEESVASVRLENQPKGKSKHFLSRTKRLSQENLPGTPQLIDSNLNEGTTIDIIYRLMLSKCARMVGFLVDIKPSLQNGEHRRAIVWKCSSCKSFYKYSDISSTFSPTKLTAICPDNCSIGNKYKMIYGEFHFEFFIKDLNSSYHTYLLVGKEAEDFFGVSTYDYWKSTEVRKCVQKSIRRLLRSHQKQVQSEFCISTRDLFSNGPKYLVNITRGVLEPE